MKEVVGDTHVLDEERRRGEPKGGRQRQQLHLWPAGHRRLRVGEEGRERRRVSDDQTKRVEIIGVDGRRSVTPINRDHNELGGREGG